MVAELVPEKSLQPKAFSLMPLVWSIGSVFGPAFGGFFARPAEQYPDVFGRIEYFKRYPFALPNLMACVIFFISFMTALLFLQETLDTKRHKRDWGLVLGEKLTRSFKRSKASPRRRRHSFVDDEASAPLLAESAMSSSDNIAVTAEPVTLGEIFTRQTSINLLSYMIMALHSVAYDQILPVFLNYPRVVPDGTNSHLPFQFTGGFGLNSEKIGTIYTVYGVACGVVQFFFFPILCARFGVLTCYRVASTFSLRPFHQKKKTPSTKLTSNSARLPPNLPRHPLHRAHPRHHHALHRLPRRDAHQRHRRHHRLPLHHHTADQQRLLAPHPRHPQRLRHHLQRHRPRHRAGRGRGRVQLGREGGICHCPVVAARGYRHGWGCRAVVDC